MQKKFSRYSQWLIFPAFLFSLQLVGCAGVLVKEELPTIAHVHIGHAKTGWKHTPGQKGLFTTAEDLGNKALSEALAAQKTQEPKEIRKHIENMMLAISAKSVKSEEGDDFDLEKSLDKAVNHITFAAESDDASQNVKDFANQFEKDAEVVLERSTLIAALGKEILASQSKMEMTLLTEELVKLNQYNVYGDSANNELGLAQLRTSLDNMISRENPPYEPVATRYLFGLVKLPSGKWAFSWLTAGDPSTRGGY